MSAGPSTPPPQATAPAAGDYAGAQQSSDNAKLWCWISLGVGLVAVLGWFGMVGLGIMADAGNY